MQKLGYDSRTLNRITSATCVIIYTEKVNFLINYKASSIYSLMAYNSSFLTSQNDKAKYFEVINTTKHKNETPT
jgi:hypothetical protein